MDDQTVAQMLASGITFEVCIDCPGGGKAVYLIDVDQVRRWCADRDQFSAGHYGVSVDDFHLWLEHDGAPLCGASTAKGPLCSNQTSRSQLGIHEWLALHRAEYCRLHSGGGQ
ncbi:hypothetical protein O4H61_03380 [Roseovarius aestuarii]|nr:hypothetical protein [Roseovarius aestuarii]